MLPFIHNYLNGEERSLLFFCLCNYSPFSDVSAPGASFMIADWSWCQGTPLCQIHILNFDVPLRGSRIRNWLSSRRLVPWINHQTLYVSPPFENIFLNGSWCVNLTIYITNLLLGVCVWGGGGGGGGGLPVTGGFPHKGPVLRKAFNIIRLLWSLRKSPSSIISGVIYRYPSKS